MKIIDNVLNDEDFKNIKNIMMGAELQWYYNHTIEFDSRDYGEYDSSYYFTHLFMFNEGQDRGYVHTKSEWFGMLAPIVSVIKPMILIRCKGNMYPSTPEILHHKPHTDYHFKHKGAIFYVNTNNGYTVIGNDKVESVENRLLLFDPSETHNSTSCTDAKVRVNINFNYF